ncbi:MAG: T9SS type A sorting domain-containing protein [Bacteroidota bacterium]
MFKSKLQRFSLCLFVFFALFCFNTAQASSFDDCESTVLEEAKCDCEVMAQFFDIQFRERCAANFTYNEEFLPCIEKAEWTVDGVFYSNDLNPPTYEFCGSGQRKICLTLKLIDGTICEYCRVVEVECPSCCTCDKIKAGIKRTPSDPCSIDLELDPQLKECIAKIKWEIGGTAFSGTLDPPAVSFTDPGPHKVCLKVLLVTGEECEICTEIKLEDCDAQECTCEKVKAGVKIGEPDGCKVDFKLDESLDPCVKDLKWAVDGVTISNDFDPAPYVFPGSGTYELCLVVVLANGKECKFCWPIKVECSDDCSCDKIEEGLGISFPTKCSVDLELKESLAPCVEKISWSVDGVEISTSINPPVYTFPVSGVYKVCVKILLINGKECEFCWEVEANCPLDCTCEEIKDGISATYPDKCSVDLELKEALKPCIEKLSWTVDGVEISNDLNPPVYTFPSSGVYEICLKVVLITGEECKFCWEVEAECPTEECNCDKIKEGLSVTYPSKCSIDLELKEALKPCIEKLSWTVNGVEISNVLNPPVYTFPASGVYTVCLKVALITGETCEICWEVKAECEPGCTCEEIKAGIDVSYPSECTIDLELKEALKPCIKRLGWFINGVLISTDLNPDVYTFPVSGVYEICLVVVLTNGEECKFCWRREVECPCSCESIRSSVNISLDANCGLDFWLDALQRPCIKDLKWGVSGIGSFTGFDPPVVQLTGSGVIEVCLKVILVTGEECLECFEVEYNCEGGLAERNDPTINVLDGVGLKLYPNPSNGLFTLEMSNAENVRVIITDLSGKTILVDQIQSNDGLIRQEFDLSQQPNGIYNITLDLGHKVLTQRLNINKQ